MSVEPYNARHKPPKADTLRLYRPRVFNRVSKSRFERNRLGEIARHVGRPLSFTERLVASRICSIEWWLLKLDAKLDHGEELAAFDCRNRLAGENRLRLDLVALGLQPPKVEVPSLSDHIARLSGKGRAA